MPISRGGEPKKKLREVTYTRCKRATRNIHIANVDGRANYLSLSDHESDESD